MTATKQNVTKRFNAGDVLSWDVYDAGPGTPIQKPAFSVPIIVIQTCGEWELFAMLHPGEPVDEVKELFAGIGLDIDDLKAGPCFIFDCVQVEDCKLLARYV